MPSEFYCAESDLYNFGIPRGALSNPARLLDGTDSAANLLLLDLHGLSADQPFTLRAEAGGSLPAPLLARTTYYAIPAGQNALQAAAFSGGSAIALTTDGERVLLIAELPVLEAIEFASRFLDECLPAHVVPLASPVPEIVRMTTAEVAAAKLAGFTGNTSVSLSNTLDAALKRIAKWAAGVPVRGPLAPATDTNRAVSATATARDSRGWRRWGRL